jgi:cyclophilin family peptidyl-prolyl cis-trans isomerase/HEAT repeat protein
MKKIVFVATILLLFSWACTSEKETPLSLDNPDIQKIIEYQNTKNDTGLIKYFVSPNMKLREKACIAFGSLKDTLALESLYTMLEEDENVAQAAAFAVGQTGHPSSIKPIKKVLQRSLNEETRFQLFVALGKCGEIDENYYLVSNYNVGKDARGTAWALFYLSNRKMINEAGIELAMKILENEKDVQTRLGAAHAIARSNLPSPWMPILTQFKNELNDDVQMALASSLKGIGADSIDLSLIDFVKNTSSNCQINFIRSVSDQDLEIVYDYCSDNINSNKSIDLQLVSADYLAAYPDYSLLFLSEANIDDLNWRVRATLLSPLVELQNDEYINEVRTRYISSQNLYERGTLLTILATLPDQRDALKKEILSNDSIIGTYGMDAYASLLEKDSNDVKILEQDFLIECTASSSPAIATYAAFLLRDSLFINTENIETLKSQLSQFQLPKMAEAYTELQNTISFMEGSESDIDNPSQNQVIDVPKLPELLKIKAFVVKTSKGEIVMEPKVFEAPETVMTIAKLIQEGYYDGKLFHRVVPNFVIQTGCPYGDGWGGLDFTMRSEFSRLQYSTGAVGMASSGQDTESCQWFVSQSPTPHLNGRYTLFAYVTSGMDVVHTIEVGDRILEMTIEY